MGLNGNTERRNDLSGKTTTPDTWCVCLLERQHLFFPPARTLTVLTPYEQLDPDTGDSTYLYLPAASLSLLRTLNGAIAQVISRGLLTR